jgi:Cysteine synthase
MGKIYKGATEFIGNTPIFQLSRLSESYHCLTQIYAKLESVNPSGSVKDRAALCMLQGAMRRGELKPGGTVIEAAGGNGGIAIAMVCAALGLQAVIVLPDTTPTTRREHLRRYGARVETVPADDGLEGCRTRARRLAEQLGNAYLPDQFSNEDNSLAHRGGTAEEILKLLPQVDYFVAGVGTGGTITGCGEVLKMRCPSCRLIAVEPMASPVLSGGFAGGHALTGIGAGFVPEILNTYLLDEVIRVRTPDAMEAAERLARTEGLLCGPSSGAALCAAVSVAQRPEAKGCTVVTILPDGGERYLYGE